MKPARQKTSIRFFNNHEVRAVWSEEESQWYFSALDIVGALNDQHDYEKNRNYWKYLKTKLKKQGVELGSLTTQFKLTAPDGKKRRSDALAYAGVMTLAENFPAAKANAFFAWFTYSDESLDGKSKQKAYALFQSPLLEEMEAGSVQSLQQIHAWLFGGLYDFAGQIRSVNIAKGGFSFAPAQFLPQSLQNIEAMPDQTLEQIFDKYVEMNVAHPFREGNGRATRLWLDVLLKQRLKQCIDWSKIDKHDYLNAMRESVADSTAIKTLLQNALTSDIDNRELFMQGIDYSYYYEQEE